MAHEFDTGFFYRQPAWHGLGNVIDTRPENTAAALELALPRTDDQPGHWEPVTRPVYLGTEAQITAEGVTPASYDALEGWNAITRDDNGEVLNVAPTSYEVISNRETFELAEALLDADSNVRYETAGSLKGGRLVWALLKLDEPFEIAGDPAGRVMPYVTVFNSHDGSGALRALSTSVRVVCANTWKAAETASKDTTFTFRHTKNVRDRIEDAKSVVRGLRAQNQVYREFFEHLLGITITERQREIFIADFIPAPEAGLVSDRVMKNVEEARGAIRAILASPTTRDTAHTAYGLVQAAGEYADHVRGWRSTDTRFNRSMLRTEPLKSRAAQLALAAASA